MSKAVHIRSFAEYQECALRTSKFAGLVYDATSQYPADPSRTAIACMGLCGELGEIGQHLTYQNKIPAHLTFKHEAGDFLYYVAELASACGITIYYRYFEVRYTRKNKAKDTITDFKKLVVEVGLLTDYLKKYIGHGKAFQQDLVEGHIYEIIDLFLDFLFPASYSLRDIAERNIKKLNKRYEEGSYSETWYKNNALENGDA